MSLQLAIPRVVAAEDTAVRVEGGATVHIKSSAENVVLRDGKLVGLLVDKSGSGVADAPVLIGQEGKLLKELRTDQEGRFQFSGAKPGVYQVVSHGGAVVYRVWTPDAAPANAKQGIIHQVDPEVARGAVGGCLLPLLTNPIFLALLIGAAIAIPLALDDDDEDAS